MKNKQRASKMKDSWGLGGSNHHTLEEGNQYELGLLASLTLVIVPRNNEMVFKVKHDRHDNHFVGARWSESEEE